MPWTGCLHKNQNRKLIPNLNFLINWNKFYEFCLFISYWVFSWTRLVSRSKKVKSNTCPFFKLYNHFSWNPIKKFEKNMLAQFLLRSFVSMTGIHYTAQGLLYRWTEHSILPTTTGGGLLTLIMIHKLTQSLYNSKKIPF